MSDVGDSPLLTAFKNIARRVAEEETRDRLNRFAQTPAGEMVRDAIARKCAIDAEGRKPTVEDIEAWVENARHIAARARAAEADD